MAKARKMLSDWRAPYIQSLMRLIETQSKETLANWALDYCARVILPLWRKHYPDDLRPQNSLEAALRAVAVENEPNPAKIDWKC
jgi:hypothetical protein